MHTKKHSQHDEPGIYVLPKLEVSQNQNIMYISGVT